MMKTYITARTAAALRDLDYRKGRLFTSSRDLEFDAGTMPTEKEILFVFAGENLDVEPTNYHLRLQPPKAVLGQVTKKDFKFAVGEPQPLTSVSRMKRFGAKWFPSILSCSRMDEILANLKSLLLLGIDSFEGMGFRDPLYVLKQVYDLYYEDDSVLVYLRYRKAFVQLHGWSDPTLDTDVNQHLDLLVKIAQDQIEERIDSLLLCAFQTTIDWMSLLLAMGDFTNWMVSNGLWPGTELQEAGSRFIQRFLQLLRWKIANVSFSTIRPTCLHQGREMPITASIGPALLANLQVWARELRQKGRDEESVVSCFQLAKRFIVLHAQHVALVRRQTILFETNAFELCGILIHLSRLVANGTVPSIDSSKFVEHVSMYERLWDDIRSRQVPECAGSSSPPRAASSSPRKRKRRRSFGNRKRRRLEQPEEAPVRPSDDVDDDDVVVSDDDDDDDDIL